MSLDAITDTERLNFILNFGAYISHGRLLPFDKWPYAATSDNYSFPGIAFSPDIRKPNSVAFISSVRNTIDLEINRLVKLGWSFDDLVMPDRWDKRRDGQ